MALAELVVRSRATANRADRPFLPQVAGGPRSAELDGRQENAVVLRRKAAGHHPVREGAAWERQLFRTVTDSPEKPVVRSAGRDRWLRPRQCDSQRSAAGILGTLRVQASKRQDHRIRSMVYRPDLNCCLRRISSRCVHPEMVLQLDRVPRSAGCGAAGPARADG